MKVDVSEIKAFKKCKRQWQLSSRNQYHMTACVPPKAFHIGTVFHESLHRLYTGKDLATVNAYIDDQMKLADPKDANMLRNMIAGYDREVMPDDRKRYKVMDIEWHFSYSPRELVSVDTLEALPVDVQNRLSDIDIVGSVDMIALDTTTNQLWGFEHKTCKSFRNDTYLWMDEQPRLYYAALQQLVEAYNLRQNEDWAVECTELYDDFCARWESWDVDRRCAEPIEPEYPPAPVPITLGGVFINEVRKLTRSFDYKRRPLVYSADDISNFMLSFALNCAECHKYVHSCIPKLPNPDMLTCMNCMYNTICETYMYGNVTPEMLEREFSQEFEKRDHDHLEEKEEIDNAGATKKKKEEV